MNRDIKYCSMNSDVYYMKLAFLTAKRSDDAQTQCGCVIVKDGHILSTGYNGFIDGSFGLDLPNLRPDKYKYIIHSELNAVLKAAKQGISLKDSVAYITGQPCPECAKSMIQAGIYTWYWSENPHSTANKEKEFLDWLIKTYGITTYYVDRKLIDE